jgi:subtilisin
MTLIDYRDVLKVADLAAEADDGLGVRVAVVDTGIPTADGVPVCLAGNFTHDDGPDTGHATFIGSILFGNREIAGVCPKATPCFCKVFEGRSAKPADVAAAIDYAVNIWHVDVVNLSLGFSSSGAHDARLRQACESAILKGVVIVASAGNDGGKVMWPASMPGVICVGSSDGEGREPFSNTGEVDVVAPGSDVYGLGLDGGIEKKTGTSFSTAMITGLMTLILARRLRRGLPTSIPELRKELLSRCIDLGREGWDEETGYGFPFVSIEKPSFISRAALSVYSFFATIRSAIGRSRSVPKNKEDKT